MKLLVILFIINKPCCKLYNCIMTVVVKRPWNFATFSNILSETFMPNLVFLTRLSLCVYLRAKFQVSSIFLASFRQGVNLPPTPPPQNEPVKSPPNGLSINAEIHSYALYCWSSSFNLNFSTAISFIISCKLVAYTWNVFVFYSIFNFFDGIGIDIVSRLLFYLDIFLRAWLLFL